MSWSSSKDVAMMPVCSSGRVTAEAIPLWAMEGEGGRRRASGEEGGAKVTTTAQDRAPQQ
jgi:hypothetical protein